jgi:hypothetical protein
MVSVWHQRSIHENHEARIMSPGLCRDAEVDEPGAREFDPRACRPVGVSPAKETFHGLANTGCDGHPLRFRNHAVRRSALTF